MAPSLRRIAALLRRLLRPADGATWVGIVIPLDGDVHAWMRRAQGTIRERYGAGRVTDEVPHLTVKQAFQAETVTPYQRYLERLAHEVGPFEVVLRGVGVFERGIVFLDVEPEPKLEALRQRVLRDLAVQFGVQPGPLEGAQYHFHATLASGLTEEQAAEARRTLEAERSEFRFPVRALGLLCSSGARWSMHRRSTVGLAGPGRPDVRGTVGPEQER